MAVWMLEEMYSLVIERCGVPVMEGEVWWVNDGGEI